MRNTKDKLLAMLRMRGTTTRIMMLIVTVVLTAASVMAIVRSMRSGQPLIPPIGLGQDDNFEVEVIRREPGWSADGTRITSGEGTATSADAIGAGGEEGEPPTEGIEVGQDEQPEEAPAEAPVPNPEDYHREFEYQDDTVAILASVDEIGVIPDEADFFCSPIDPKSEEYYELLGKTAEYYGVSDDMIEIYPYDMGFVMEDEEVEPTYGEVSVQFDFKKPIEVGESENVDILHITSENETQVMAEGIGEEGTVDSAEIGLRQFSPVVFAKTNLGSSPLKSTQMTDDQGNEYYISKTPNIGNDGIATGYYGNGMNTTDVISLYGAMETNVVIQYRTESTSYDWLYIKDADGNILKRDADGRQIGDTNGKIGGGGSSSLTPSNTVEYRFEQDELQFVWRTDGSVVSYGYYAVITPTYVTTPVPAYHFEELEDGTYALVFDQGGDIEAFLNRPEVRDDIAPYRNQISEIRLHKDTTSVDQGAFKNLSSLRKVTIPRNSQLGKIGKGAFSGCENLESFSVPPTVTDISSSAFTGCVSMESFSFSPSNQMTTLPAGLFKGLTSLSEVTLPVGLTEVPADLFNGCTSLQAVDVPAGVTKIGDRAFQNTRISELPDLTNITEIGSRAFANNPRITEVSIPPSVTTLGDAFYNCSGITDFVFEDGTSFPTLPNEFFYGMSQLRNVTLPSDLTRLSNGMFQGCSTLEHVDFPDTVTVIGDNAFYNCTRLKDFEIPRSVTTIGGYAFYNCDALRDMVIPNTVTSVGSYLFAESNNLLRLQFESGSPINSLPTAMLQNCSSLETINLPDGVTTIPSSYFRGCSQLKHVELPQNLTSIGDYAFHDCRALENMTFPSSLRTIGQYAFYNCDSITDITLPNSVTTIGPYAFYNADSITNITIPNSVTSIGSYAFYSCKALESFVWEEGSPMTSLQQAMFRECPNLKNLVLPTGLTSIPAELAYGCTKLEHVDIPSGVSSIGNYAFYGCSVLDDVILPENCTQINEAAFRGSGLTHIELPEALRTISTHAFYNTKISSILIPKSTTSIGTYAFASNGNLESVMFEEDGALVSLGSHSFQDNPKLSTVTTNNRISSIGRSTFQNDRRLQQYTIDSNVALVQGMAFNNDIGLTRLEIKSSPTNTALNIDSETSSNYYNYTFGNLTSLEELIVDRDLTSSYNRTLEFANMNPNVHITIGSHVDNLDNMLVSMFTNDTEISFVGENDFHVTTRVSNRSTDAKWSHLTGDFYVDSQGVLYKLNDTDHTASVFYIPKGITDYTVPATITSVAGNTYNVTSIESYTVRSASDLVSLTFENPQQVTIPQFAFSHCPSLHTINGRDELYMDDWTEVSLLCDFPVHTDNPPQQVLVIHDSMPVGEGEGSGPFSFAVSISGQEKMDEDNPLTYVYPTGLASRFDFAISNESNVDMSDRVIRIYLAFTGDSNYTLGSYPPGDYTLVNTATGDRYPFKMRATDAEGVYYYDITGFGPGDTLAFNNNFAYTSPGSGGGDLIVWVESLSAEEAAAREGKTSQPNNYIRADWYTHPTPYRLTKAVLGSPQFQFASNPTDAEDENIYVKNMQYRIQLSSEGGGATAYAKDYIKYIDVEDEIQLNEHMTWNPKVIEAIENEEYYYNNSNSYLYVKVDNIWVELCHMSFPDTSKVRSIVPKVVTDDDGNKKVVIDWSYRNTYWSDVTASPTADLPATTFDIYVGTHAVQVKQDSDLWMELREGHEFTDEQSLAMRQISNEVYETSHYSYSEDRHLVAQSPNRTIFANNGFSMSKTMVGETTFGREHAYNITMTNSGLTHKDDIDLVTDTLNKHYYIKADDLEDMFADAKWGPFLNVNIASVTLCTLPDRHAVDVYGNEFTITDAQYSGIDPIPYNGAAGSDISEVTTSAKMSIHWDDTHQHLVLELKNDQEELQHSYTIGQGCDYETLDDAFKSIGFVVTYRATYDISWDLGDTYTLYHAHADGVEAETVDDLTDAQKAKYEYRLKSGKSDTLHIPSSIKRTDMFLEADRGGRYSSSSISSSNTAYAKDDTGRQVGSGTWSGYIYSELSLSKSAVVNGQSLSGNFRIPDDTVVDYALSFTNSGDRYDVLPLTDRMTGSQVLLVPVRTNRTALYYESGSETGVPLQDAGLRTYTSNGIEYYALEKAGSYKDVIIDGRITDTIKVSRGAGVADTFMIWYYQDLDGSTIASANTTKTITYKALANSAWLGGGQSEDEHGSTVTNHALNNQSWLGGHQTHRLVASMGGATDMLQFSKSIVENPNSPHENLIRHSLIKDGDEVLYKMIIKNTSDATAVIHGNRIHDELPSTGGIFEWAKGTNVLDIYYVTEGLGSSVETTGSEYWYVNSIEPNTGANTASRGEWYIYWNDDFSMSIEGKGEVWLYVRLKFPSSSDMDGDNPSNVWDDYIAKNNGGVLTNDFYLGGLYSEVTHELVDVVEGMLQKGVMDTGLSTSGKFQSEDTRHYYQNGSNNSSSTSVQEVAYYTVIYNSGNVRLYLDKLQDQLPKGFKFRNLFNIIPNTVQASSNISTQSNGSYYNYIGGYNSISSLYSTEYSVSGKIPIATVNDAQRENITYKGASVSASSTTVNGRDQVTFTIGSSGSSLSYDSTLSKYYLNPGEAIRFGYVCTVEGYARTENIANNEIAMPVYDKYGLGVRMSNPEQVQIVPATYRDIATNDGGCDMTTTEEETIGYEHTKPTWVKNTTDWFSSNVSLQRLFPVPGILKTIGGETYLRPNETISPNSIYGSKYTDGSKTGSPYVGTIARTSVANWMIRAYNEGGIGSNAMEDYTIVDTVDAPYRFTGNFFYDYYNLHGVKMTSSSVPVFSLGGRTENDTTVRISTGQGSSTMTLDGTITINGDPVSVDGGRVTVQLLQDEAGNETIKIRFADNYHRLPPNTYMALVAHTQYISSDVVLSKQFYNHAQLEPSVEFDPALVSQGHVLYREEDEEQVPYAIESGASVTMTAGYTSAAMKQVTQMGLASNTGWSNSDENSIILPDKFSKFYYDLYVDLPEDDPTQKLVIIDALPEVGDHSPFVERDLRESEFKVRILGDNPGFTVWSSPNQGSGTKVQLGYDQYTLEVTTRHEFLPEDWEGNGEGWTTVNLSDGVDDAEIALLDAARAFRVVIVDEILLTDPHSPDLLMGKNHQVQIRFNGEIETPAEADPGEIAWNSFGYRYTVPIGATGMMTSLNAEPLKVGVQVPAVPYVIKDQKTPHNHYKPIETATTYRFLVYTGSSIADLADTSEMTPAEIAGVLATNEREFTITSLQIGGNESTGRTEYLDDEKKWELSGDAFAATDEHWTWVNAAKYTILELPWEENGFRFSDIQHSPVNNYTFTQNEENNVVLRVTNVWAETGNLTLRKTVNGPNFDPERRFTFTITLHDGRYPAFGSYDYTGTNIRDGSLTFDDSGTASIQLRHDQAITLTGIPAGYTYQITESDDEWYTQTAATNVSGTMVPESTIESSFTNTRKSSSLQATKNVVGNMGDKSKRFEFEIYIVDEGEELNGSYPIVIHRNDGTDETVTDQFVDGAVVLHLAHGDVAEVTGLPFGARYTVDELASSRRGYRTSSENDTGILGDDTITATWTNTKDGMVPTLRDFRMPDFMFVIYLASTAAAFVLMGKRHRLLASKRDSGASPSSRLPSHPQVNQSDTACDDGNAGCGAH